MHVLKASEAKKNVRESYGHQSALKADNVLEFIYSEIERHSLNCISMISIDLWEFPCSLKGAPYYDTCKWKIVDHLHSNGYAINTSKNIVHISWNK